VDAKALERYLVGLRWRDRIGVAEFSKMLVTGVGTVPAATQYAFTKPIVMYHAWMPGFVAIDRDSPGTLDRSRRRILRFTFA